jgi:hypothetical protein
MSTATAAVINNYKSNSGAYTDHSVLNDLVYQGGFLLKPRSKLATYQQHEMRKRQVKDSLERTPIQTDEQRELIKVKSLDVIIK